jgi:hypothetical protein
MKLNTKSSLLAGVAIALASAAYMPQASATIYNLGASGVTPVLTPFAAGENPAASNILTAKGAFTDFFDFKLTSAASDFIATGNAIAGTTVDYGARFTSFKLYAADRTTVVAAGSVSNVGKVFSSIIIDGGLAANTLYSIGISGIGTGTKGGIYSLSVSTSPVPEPEEWAMMMVGAGLVSFQIRRKQKAMSQTTLA